MITIAVIVIISFAYWGGSRRGGGIANMRESHDTAFTLYGREYSGRDLAKLEREMQLAFYFGLYEFAMGLPEAAAELKSTDANGPQYDAVGNLLVLREIAARTGIVVSDAEAKKRLETLRPFQKDNKYDPVTAAETEERMKANGISADDILALAKDAITYERLVETAGANFSPSPVLVDKSYAHDQQTIHASSISFELEDFKKKAEVKDDEIQKYFDENKDDYKTNERRAAAYVFFELPKPDEKKPAEENQKAQKAYADLVNKFDSDLHQPGADFNAVVAATQKAHPEIKLQTLSLFERASPPEAVKSENKFVSALFLGSMRTGSVSPAIESPKGYYFFKVTQIEESRPQQLAEVKDKIKETLVAQKAQDAMLAAANDARTVVLAALKEGKKLEDVAKQKGWKLEVLPEFSPKNPPATPPDLNRFAATAGDTAVGDATKPQPTEKGTSIIVVTAKELRKRDDSPALKQSQESQLAMQMKEELFKAWFAKERKAAGMTLVMGK